MRVSDNPLAVPKCSMRPPLQRNTPLPLVPIQSEPSRAGHNTRAQASFVYSVKRGTKRPAASSDTGPHCVPAQIVPAASWTIEPITLLGKPSAVEYIVTRFGLRRVSPPLSVATHTLPSGSS